MIISVNPEVVFREEADNNGILYLYNQVFKLNRTGVFVWRLLWEEKNIETGKLKKILVNKYEISERIMEQDLTNLFRQMKKMRLIEIKEEA